MGEALEGVCERLRDEIQGLGDMVRALMVNQAFSEDEDFMGQHGEMRANLMLSYRHLEDARMRLGKVMQQIQGGKSIFDREKEES